MRPGLNPPKSTVIPRAYTGVDRMVRPAENGGSSYAKPSHIIRAKYNNVDKNTVTLGNYVNTDDISKLRFDRVKKDIGYEIARAQKVVDNNKSKLPNTVVSRAKQYLENAKNYLEGMARLQKSWESGFYVQGFGMVSAWPLDMSYNDLRGCAGKPPGYRSTSGLFGVSCPTENEVTGHGLDRSYWKRLADTAAMNARAATEAIYKAIILELNKKEYYDSRIRSGETRTTSAPGRTGAKKMPPKKPPAKGLKDWAKDIKTPGPTPLIPGLNAGEMTVVPKDPIIPQDEVDDLLDDIDAKSSEIEDGEATDGSLDQVEDEVGPGIDADIGSDTTPPPDPVVETNSKSKSNTTPLLVAVAAVGAFFMFTRN